MDALYLCSYKCCSVAQSCPVLWGLMNCSPPGSLVHGASLGKNTGVGCHAVAFSICSKWWLLPRCSVWAPGGGSSCCRAWLQGMGAPWLHLAGLVVPWHVGSSWTRNWTHVSCTGSWILNHRTTREVLNYYWKNYLEVS